MCFGLIGKMKKIPPSKHISSPKNNENRCEISRISGVHSEVSNKVYDTSTICGQKCTGEWFFLAFLDSSSSSSEENEQEKDRNQSAIMKIGGNKNEEVEEEKRTKKKIKVSWHSQHLRHFVFI